MPLISFNKYFKGQFIARKGRMNSPSYGILNDLVRRIKHTSCTGTQKIMDVKNPTKFGTWYVIKQYPFQSINQPVFI